MNQQTKYTFHSENVRATEVFAASIGQQVKGGEIIQLIGDVGAGKTTFVRGFVRGIGSTDLVTSPTFTVSNVYDSPNLTVHHYDFYRIEDVAIMQQELSEVIADPGSVAILEWAGAVADILPDEHITIRMHATSENVRAMTCSLPPKNNYIGLSL